MPVLGEAMPNPLLTEFALMLGTGEVIYRDLFPSIAGVTSSAGRFPEIDPGQEAARLDQLERAINSAPARFQFALSDAKTYNTKDRTIDHAIDDKIRAIYRSIVDVQRAATKIATQKLNIVRENLVASLVTDTSRYPSSNRITLSGTSQWSDYTNSDPIVNIQDAIAQVALTSGYRPNVFWCSLPVWNKLSAHPDVTAFAGTGATRPVSPEEFARAFNLRAVLISSATYVTTKRGQTVTRDWIFGKNAGLAYVPETPSVFEVALGVRVPWEELQVGVWRDESTKSDVVRVGEDADYVFLYGEAGFLFASAIA